MTRRGPGRRSGTRFCMKPLAGGDHGLHHQRRCPKRAGGCPVKSLLYKDYLVLRFFLMYFLLFTILLLLTGFIKIHALLPMVSIVALIIPFQLTRRKTKTTATSL